MQDNDETITLDWSTLSSTEKQEIFYAHTKALGRVLEVIRNTKASPELTRTDVDRAIFGKTIDELAECWQLAQQDLLISPNDVLRIFTRYRDSKQAIEYLINAHTFAKDEGLSEFESRELFIRSGISDYEQIVYEYKKTKIEIQEAGMPTLWGEVIALRSGKEYVDQNLIKAGLMPSQRENKNRRA